MASPTVAAAAPSASVSQTPAEKAAAAAAKAAKALRKCAPDLSPSRSSAPKAAVRPSDWRADLFLIPLAQIVPAEPSSLPLVRRIGFTAALTELRDARDGRALKRVGLDAHS